MSGDPWDDWETAADAGLIDCKEHKKVGTNQEIWEKANSYSTPVIVHTNNESGRSEFKPTIKVLKRPVDAKYPREDAALTQKSFKGLAEREKDYEEAKRKIDEKFSANTQQMKK